MRDQEGTGSWHLISSGVESVLSTVIEACEIIWSGPAEAIAGRTQNLYGPQMMLKVSKWPLAEKRFPTPAADPSKTGLSEANES